jgi:hypothetical protein
VRSFQSPCRLVPSLALKLFFEYFLPSRWFQHTLFACLVSSIAAQDSAGWATPLGSDRTTPYYQKSYRLDSNQLYQDQVIFSGTTFPQHYTGQPYQVIKPGWITGNEGPEPEYNWTVSYAAVPTGGYARVRRDNRPIIGGYFEEDGTPFRSLQPPREFSGDSLLLSETSIEESAVLLAHNDAAPQELQCSECSMTFTKKYLLKYASLLLIINLLLLMTSRQQAFQEARPTIQM